MHRKNRSEINIPYIYIVGSPSDNLVRFFSSTNSTLDDILIWHLEKYSSESIGIFTFKDIEEALQVFISPFRPKRIADGIYRVSFDEARFYLLLEQRHQNGIELPLCINLSVLFKRIITYLRLNIFRNSVKRRKYLHDDIFFGKKLSNVEICHEGFIN